MSVLADVFAAVRLQLDGTGFEAQATALADKQGRNVGDRMSQNLNSKLKSALGGAIGAGAGLAFSAMVTGANELDAATRQLQTDTGMTAEAAGRAEHALAGMYQHNLQGFGAIGATMAVVINGLDLTGAAADAMTEKFLKFETATGQDSAAVQSFHEILNAWNLTAEAAPGIMDLLIASHQKYGSSIADNEAALQKLAPQMRALGMDITDTVNLLNLFDAAGMDSSKAMFALNTAVKNLKPGQTLDDLIKQITAIQDPTLRAQEAIKLFGARGGVNLANALRPGITSLADFATSAADTAGATDKAAAAVESGFGNQATMLLHQFGGALAEIGTNFGGLAMLAAVVGPGLFRGLSSALGGLAGVVLPRIVAGFAGAEAVGTAAGTATGGAFGAAVGLAVPAIVGAAIAAIGIGIALGVNELAPGLAKSMHDDFFTGVGAVGDMMFGREWQHKIVPVAQDAGQTAGTAVSTGLKYGLLAGAPEVKAAAAKLAADMLADTAAERIAAGAAAGGDVAQGLADGIKSARAKPLDAFNALIEMLKHPLTKTGEFTRLGKELVSKELAAGLTSADPEIRAAAKAVKDDILTRMAEMKPDAGIIGKDTTQALADGLKSSNPEVRANALLLQQIVTAALGDTMVGAGAAGTAAGKAFMAAVQAALTDHPLHLKYPVYAPGETPKPKPVSGQTAAQQRTRRGAAMGGAVRAGEPIVVGEYRPELFVPETNGTILPSVPPVGASGNTYHVNVQGLIRARDPFEIATQLRRLGDFGTLTRQVGPA